MPDADIAGFWSYVHDDDSADGGRIVRLAQLVESEYSMITGRAARIFVDRRDIAWGDEWRRRIDDALTGAFIIPIITPRYFMSDECRRELVTFAGHAESLGVTELILPLLYVDVADLSEHSGDELKALVARTHYGHPWTALRLEDERSGAYRTAVNRLARRLVEIAETVRSPEERVAASRSGSAGDRGEDDEEPEPVVDGEGPREDSEPAADSRDGAGDEDHDEPEPDGGGGREREADEEPPGLIDILADMEAALPRWSATMTQMTEILERVSESTREATQRMERADRAGKGFAGRVASARYLARQIDAPANELFDLATAYAQELVAIDAGVLTFVRMVEEEDLDAESRAALAELFGTIREMVATSRENATSIDEYVATLDVTARYSKDLRRPVTRLQEALRRIRDGQAVMEEWERRFDQLEAAR